MPCPAGMSSQTVVIHVQVVRDCGKSPYLGSGGPSSLPPEAMSGLRPSLSHRLAKCKSENTGHTVCWRHQGLTLLLNRSAFPGAYPQILISEEINIRLSYSSLVPSA